MKLYWSPRTRSSRAIWMLEEAGVDYELERIDIQDPQRSDPPEFREASPMGKVPALVDGDVKMSESAAICLYVADRYAAGGLAPALDDPAKSSMACKRIVTAQGGATST
jgi:glutathione S-transferase